jgi:hypothetical protein
MITIEDVLDRTFRDATQGQGAPDRDPDIQFSLVLPQVQSVVH